MIPNSQLYARPGYWTETDFVELAHPGDGGNAITGNATTIIGQTFVVTPGVGITQISAALWDQNERRTISGLGGVESYSRDINHSGSYVGVTVNVSTGTFGGFIGRDGTATRLDFPGFPETRVYEINDSGQFVGVYEPVNNRVRGYVATHDLDTGQQTIRDLGLFPGYTQTWVYANNNEGTIVGGAVADFGDFDRALIWPAGAAEPIDLNALVNLPGVTLINAYRINNAGQILAEARLDAGGFAYYRLDPVPEPGAGLLATAAVVLMRRGSRREAVSPGPSRRRRRRGAR